MDRCLLKAVLFVAVLVLGASGISLPGVPTVTPLPTSVVTAVAAVNNVVSNALCELQPTHLLCNTSVRYGHKIEQNMPAQIIWRPCSVLTATPHCCKQFCQPASGGNCDLTGGACFCNPAGKPNVCGLLTNVDSDLGSMSANDLDLLNICVGKCKLNPNGCTKAAAATDGIAGTVCVCYCDPPTPTTTSNTTSSSAGQAP